MDFTDPLGLEKKFRRIREKERRKDNPGEQEFHKKRDCSKGCPKGQEKTVVIKGDIAGPWYDLTGGPWNVVCSKYVDDAADRGENVEYYPRGVSVDQLQDIISDPCVTKLIIISHGSGVDGVPEFYPDPQSEDWVTPDDIKYWVNGCDGLEEVVIRACGQGYPSNADDWRRAFNLDEDEMFYAPGYNDRWFRNRYPLPVCPDQPE